MRNPRSVPGLPRVSSTLRRMLRNVYQAEPLEQRILLSADPAGAIAHLLHAESDPSMLGGGGATIVPWEEAPRPSTFEAPIVSHRVV